MSTLVVQTAFLGDVVLTTPLLEELARQHGPVDVITTPAARDLVKSHPAVRRAIGFDKNDADRGIGGLWRMARVLRSMDYERAYLPHQSWRSAMLAVLAGIPKRIGFKGAPAQLAYTRRIVRPVELHETDRMLALAGTTDTLLPSLGIDDSDHQMAADWLAGRQIPAEFVVMAPGSVWGTKRWGGYSQLAAECNYPIVVIGGPEDHELGNSIVAAAPDRSWNAAGELPLMASAALLKRAKALVTNDSLPLHMGQATATPTVAIFGPTVPAFGFGPRGAKDRVVELSGLDCRPCSSHGPAVCPLAHHNCMKRLSTVQVAEALDSITSD